MTDLDLRLFRYAVASAERGSFRRAATALSVQQSTISRGIRYLEYQLGAQLFERGYAGVRPTPAGDRFLEEASLGFAHLERAMQRARASQRGDQGQITIAASVSLSVLEGALNEFRGKHEGISIEAVESTCSGGCLLVEQRKVDVAFVSKVGSTTTLRSLYLRDEPVLVALPGSHRLATASVLRLEEIQGEQFILGATGLGPEIQDYLRRSIATTGGEPKIQPHNLSQCGLVSMVAWDAGITIIVGELPANLPRGVVFVPVIGGGAFRLHAVWADSNPNPALKRLLDTVRHHLGQSMLSGLSRSASPPAQA